MIDAGFGLSEIREVMGKVFPENISYNPKGKFDQNLGFKRLMNANHGRKKPNIDRGSPEGILVINDFIDGKTCDMLKKYADSQDYTDLGVVDFKKSNKYKIETTMDEGRISNHIEIDGKAYEIISIFNEICRFILTPFYDVNVEWYERPQLLRYSSGGRYDSHTDSERWLKNRRKWMRVLDRDYSILLYLNDEYEGGEIQFSRQLYTIKPKSGMLVIFPSDNRYMHGALPTLSGIRYAIVSWVAIIGSRRVRTRMSDDSVYIRQKCL